MKRIFLGGAAIAVTVLISGQLAAAQTQTKTHTETVTEKTGPGPDTKDTIETVTGRVTEYEAGKEIEIEGPKGKKYEFDLDENARVEGLIAVGRMATVQYRKENDGTERVVVLSDPAKKKTKTKKTQPDAHAAHGETQAATGARMHAESTTKQTGPGPNTKTKSEVVIGLVKEYEAGKKITLVGPKDEDHTFALDEQVAVKGTITVGQTARVEYTKGNDGVERVMILAHEAKSDLKEKS